MSKEGLVSGWCDIHGNSRLIKMCDDLPPFWEYVCVKCKRREERIK